MTIHQPTDLEPNDFGAGPTIEIERTLTADERVTSRWDHEIERANKARATNKLTIRSPLETLPEVMLRRTLPPMPWPAAWPELARRCRTNPGDITSLVGGTGSGKTQLAIELARAFSAANRGCVIWAPLEIQPPDLSIRIVANLTKTQMMEIRDRWTEKQIQTALATVTDRWRFVEMPRGGSLEDQISAIDAAVELATKIYNAPPLLVVDYVQLMASTEEQRAAVSAAIQGLESVTVVRGCYSFVLSQTSRSNSPALAGKVDIESATDLVGAAAETSLVERASANMIVMNVFKADDCPILDAHLNASKCRNTGLEGKIGARYHKAGGWWEELDHLPATPTEIAAALKKAKRAKDATANATDIRANLNAERSNAANSSRREAIVKALRAAGARGLGSRDIRKVKGSGSPRRSAETIAELERGGRIRCDLGRWILVN